MASTLRGVIEGYYADVDFVYHGFLRAPDGTFTTFDAPGAGTLIFEGTIASRINPAGAIAGYYSDATFVAHGFLRAKDGTFTTFDAPAAGTGFAQGTYVTMRGLNPAGAVAGTYVDAGRRRKLWYRRRWQSWDPGGNIFANHRCHFWELDPKHNSGPDCAVIPNISRGT